MFKGDNRSKARDGSRRARLVLRRWRCVGHTTPYSAGLTPPNLRLAAEAPASPGGGPSLGHFSCRTGSGSACSPPGHRQPEHTLFCRGTTQRPFRRFSECPKAPYISVLGFRSLPPDKISPTGLRPFSGSADPPVPPRPLRNATECRRPTAFTGPPLLTGDAADHYPQLGGCLCPFVTRVSAGQPGP